MSPTPTTTDPPATITLPWGMHQGRPPSEVDADYLRWFASTCRVSPGVRAAIEAELRRRGIEPPSPPEPQPVPPCRRHPTAAIAFAWGRDRSGRRHIRATCSQCRRFLRFAPQVSPYADLANQNGKEAPTDA